MFNKNRGVLVNSLFVVEVQGLDTSPIVKTPFDKSICVSNKVVTLDTYKLVRLKQGRWYLWRDNLGGHDMQVGERVWK